MDEEKEFRKQFEKAFKNIWPNISDGTYSDKMSILEDLVNSSYWYYIDKGSFEDSPEARSIFKKGFVMGLLSSDEKSIKNETTVEVSNFQTIGKDKVYGILETKEKKGRLKK